MHNIFCLSRHRCGALNASSGLTTARSGKHGHKSREFGSPAVARVTRPHCQAHHEQTISSDPYTSLTAGRGRMSAHPRDVERKRHSALFPVDWTSANSASRLSVLGNDAFAQDRSGVTSDGSPARHNGRSTAASGPDPQTVPRLSDHVSKWDKADAQLVDV